MSITIWQRTNSNIITQALVSGKKNIPRVFFFTRNKCLCNITITNIEIIVNEQDLVDSPFICKTLWSITGVT